MLKHNNNNTVYFVYLCEQGAMYCDTFWKLELVMSYMNLSLNDSSLILFLLHQNMMLELHLNTEQPRLKR